MAPKTAMHILIEALGARVGGGITRLLGTIDALLRIAPQHRYSVILSPTYQQALIERMPNGIAIIPMAVSGGNLLKRSWMQNVVVARIARAVGADVLFAAGEGAYFRSAVPLVMMCGNLALFEGDTAGLLYGVLRRPFLLRSFRTATKIAFVSESMRDAVLASTSLPPQKGFVVHHGVDGRFLPRTDEGAGTHYLAVSTISPHKGYETLLEAYAQLPSAGPRLRIAGGVQHQPTYERMQEIIRRRDLSSRVDFLGSVPYEQLPDLYRDARALLFPSELESFGLPLLEAMASGVPVIATSLPVCREICGDAVLYFAPRDPAALAHRIRELEEQPALRRTLSDRGVAMAGRFTWEDSARSLLSGLRSAQASSYGRLP